MKKRFDAIVTWLDGSTCKTWVQKHENGSWLIGGDNYDKNTMKAVTVISKKNNRRSYFKLQGNRLIFSDFVGDLE